MATETMTVPPAAAPFSPDAPVSTPPSIPPTPALSQLVSQSAAVPKMSSIPLLVAVLAVAQDYIANHKLLAKTEHRLVLLGEWITANVVLRLGFLAGAFLMADSLTAKLLDKAEKVAPVVFTATTNDVSGAVLARYAGVRSFALGTGSKAHGQFDQLKAEHVTLQRAYDSLISLNTQLIGAGIKAKNAGTSVSTTVQTEVDKTMTKVHDELERLHHYLMSLPNDARVRMQPVQQTFRAKYDEVVGQLKDRNTPLAARATALTSYVTNSTLPALNKALHTVSLTKSESKITTVEEVLDSESKADTKAETKV